MLVLCEYPSGGGAMGGKRSESQEEGGHPLLAATSHPTRREILRCFREHSPISATEVAKRLGLPKSTVAQHVRQLRSEGLIEQNGEERKRGTVGKLYGDTDGARWLSNEDWVTLSPDQKASFVTSLIRSLRTYLAAAMRANSGDFGVDSCWGTTLYSVDEQGWSELVAIHRQTMAAVDRIAEESQRRMAERPSVPRQACSTLYLFEMPDGSPLEE